MRDADVTRALLDWYDIHARSLPWRVPPDASQTGQRADPYRVWLSEVMLQQTTVAAVKDYFHRFMARWPGVADLAAAADADVMAEWAGLGYYARARNLLACARAVVADHGGRFPETEAGLRALPGIGAYTAAAIAAIAFGRAAVVVDGNVERVMARLHGVRAPLPGAKPELTALAARHTPQDRPGDHAQAVMDLGATICTPRNPACGICPLQAFCMARAEGIAAELPAKVPKAAKPTRHGTVWIARRPVDGALLVERRPPRGLLGGMPGFPGSNWESRSPAPASPPFAADWRPAGEVRHTFTHFHLILSVEVAEVSGNPDRGEFLPPSVFDPTALPTLMRKAHDLASQAFLPR
ncbi:A/G-specific adenine glycosylase [Szabonella alba]|uniref:Adenine DNA glycosylase n=1 Tax=Szabonella alba TaxID=2804194 RepID=A0A8K0Y2C1_9RHOB|nr:A/G-specific adenine glycosylase [Szabonella alba]MBL4919097.1 A/G-specific adenine glycosylase [Szabonella alba]